MIGLPVVVVILIQGIEIAIDAEIVFQLIGLIGVSANGCSDVFGFRSSSGSRYSDRSGVIVAIVVTIFVVVFELFVFAEFDDFRGDSNGQLDNLWQECLEFFRESWNGDNGSES